MKKRLFSLFSNANARAVAGLLLLWLSVATLSAILLLGRPTRVTQNAETFVVIPFTETPTPTWFPQTPSPVASGEITDGVPVTGAQAGTLTALATQSGTPVVGGNPSRTPTRARTNTATFRAATVRPRNPIVLPTSTSRLFYPTINYSGTTQAVARTATHASTQTKVAAATGTAAATLTQIAGTFTALPPTLTRLAEILTALPPAATPTFTPTAPVKPIAYTQNGDLGRVLPDGSGQAWLVNAPSPVLENMGDWSPDGQKLVFTLNDGVLPQLWIYDVAANSSALLAGQPAAVNDQPAWSPDGAWIVFRSQPSGGTPVIMVMPAAGGTAAQLTDGASGEEYEPDWYDNGRIMYVRAPDATHADIYTVPWTGSAPLPLPTPATLFVSDEKEASPHRSGNWLVFARQVGGQWDIFKTSTDNLPGWTNLTNTTGINETQPAWSNPGDWIVYVRDDGLYILLAAGGTPLKVGAVLDGATSPNWQP